MVVWMVIYRGTIRKKNHIQYKSKSHLSKLPGNKKLNFFGEPFYVLPKS